MTIKIAIALILILALTGCTTNAVVTDINIAIVAIDLAAPVVAAFGGSQAQAISNYLILATNGLNCVLTAATASGSTTATVAAAITSCLGTVVAPNIPGLPANIAAIITAVTSAITTIIVRYGVVNGPALKVTMMDKHKARAYQVRLNKDLVMLTAK